MEAWGEGGTLERNVTEPGSDVFLGGRVLGREQPVQRLRPETAGFLRRVLNKNTEKGRRAFGFRKQAASLPPPPPRPYR